MYKVFYGSDFEWKEIETFDDIQSARYYIREEINSKNNHSFYVRIFPSEDFKSIFFDYGNWSSFYKIECEQVIDFHSFMNNDQTV